MYSCVSPSPISTPPPWSPRPQFSHSQPPAFLSKPSVLVIVDKDGEGGPFVIVIGSLQSPEKGILLPRGDPQVRLVPLVPGKSVRVPVSKAY